jgi:hypothetical protein
MTVVELRNRYMTDAEYEAERARLRETYGDSKKEAGVRYEQALAVLFHRSGWTQEKLAKKEGKSPSRIVRLIQFGRFLNLCGARTNPDSLPNNLTETKFRTYWERTDKTQLNERASRSRRSKRPSRRSFKRRSDFSKPGLRARSRNVRRFNQGRKNMTERKIVSEQWFVWGEVNRARSQILARPFKSIIEAQDAMAGLGKVNPAIRYFLSRAGEERGIQ